VAAFSCRPARPPALSRPAKLSGVDKTIEPYWQVLVNDIFVNGNVIKTEDDGNPQIAQIPDRVRDKLSRISKVGSGL